MLRFFPRTFRSGLLAGAALAVAVAAAAITYERYDTQTLKRTVKRGELLCGVSTGLPGFSLPDAKGNWSGFDVDICRAIAAAIFNDPGKVRFVSLDASERFTELQKRKIDVLSRNSTWSMSRETNYALNFAAVSYYDGQGFMLRKARNIDSGLELDGSKVCVQESTTTQLNLADYFRANNIKYQEMKFARADDVVKAYEFGPLRCVYRGRVAALLAAHQALQAGRPCHPGGRDLEGAAGAGGAAQGRRLAADREMDGLRHAQCGGAWHHLEEYRRGAEVQQAGGDAAGRHGRHLWRATRARAETGPPASSVTSATTARSTSAISGPARSSAFRAA